MATPIIETIALDIKSTLEGVTAANGYDNTLIVERAKQLGNKRRDQLAVIHQGDPVGMENPPAGYRSWEQVFFVIAYVVESESSATAIDSRINSIRSDIEKAMMADATRGGLAVDTLIRDHELVGFERESVEAIIMRFDVHYRVLENDPYNQ